MVAESRIPPAGAETSKRSKPNGLLTCLAQPPQKDDTSLYCRFRPQHQDCPLQVHTQFFYKKRRPEMLKEGKESRKSEGEDIATSQR